MNTSMSSENAEMFIRKLRQDKLRQYMGSNIGMNCRDETVFKDYVTYNSFLKTSLFHSIARKNNVPKPTILEHFCKFAETGYYKELIDHS